jgi:sigma-B regulation protein RsbU (phosphoserine phosphatase)
MAQRPIPTVDQTGVLSSNRDSAESGRRAPLWGIRFQLLLALNTTLAVLVVVFLVYDYRRELRGRLREKQIALEEEAKTLMPAVLQMRQYGHDSVQHYVDAVCGRMKDAESPGHHIAVRLGDFTLQAKAHHRASPEILRAMQQAARSPTGRALYGGTELVVGSYHHSDASVFVSEALANLHRSVIGDGMRRLAGALLLALLGALIINVVLLRVVIQPLGQLVATVRRIASGQLGVQTKPFQSAEFAFLAGEVNAMSTALAAADRDRAAQMAKARTIQENLLPQMRDVPGLTVAHLFRPASAVGGDFFDILCLPDGACLFCIADVTGHGVPAALSATVLKALLISAVERHQTPSKIFDSINRRFASLTLQGDFATMLLVRIDAERRTLDYASAGHEVAWLLDDGVARKLASTGLVLGIDEAATWDDQRLSIRSGSRLLMVTDGITETQNARGEFFGRLRPPELLEECRGVNAKEAVRRIEKQVVQYRQGTPQDDDVTLLLVDVGRRVGQAETEDNHLDHDNV